jgi:hypothetical protein
MLYDHQVEIVALTDQTGTALEDWDIRHLVQAWLDDNDARAALSQEGVIWFAHEVDATLFYLRFS